MTTINDMLVSELPAGPAAVPSRCASRRAMRRFEKALRVSDGQERIDLLAQVRAQRTVTRTLS